MAWLPWQSTVSLITATCVAADETLLSPITGVKEGRACFDSNGTLRALSCMETILSLLVLLKKNHQSALKTLFSNVIGGGAIEVGGITYPFWRGTT